MSRPTSLKVPPQKWKPPFAPGGLEHRESLFARDSERRALVCDDVEEASPGQCALPEPLRIVRLHRALRRLVEPLLAHRQREVRRALEHDEVRGDPAGFLDDLDAAGARSDHADPTTGQVEAVLRPVGGVQARPQEAFETRHAGHVGPGREARARDEHARSDPPAVGALDLPLVGVGVEARRDDAAVESDVARQRELLVHVTEVAPQLVPGGEALRPVPVAPQHLHRELVVRHVRIDAGPRIAVPVPDAAEVGPGLDDTHVKSPLAQPVQLVQAAEAGADDQRVENFHRRRLLRARGAAARRRPARISLGSAYVPSRTLRIRRAVVLDVDGALDADVQLAAAVEQYAGAALTPARRAAAERARDEQSDHEPRAGAGVPEGRRRRRARRHGCIHRANRHVGVTRVRSFQQAPLGGRRRGPESTRPTEAISPGFLALSQDDTPAGACIPRRA
jgi:hypothetical protein